MKFFVVIFCISHLVVLGAWACPELFDQYADPYVEPRKEKLIEDTEKFLPADDEVGLQRSTLAELIVKSEEIYWTHLLNLEGDVKWLPLAGKGANGLLTTNLDGLELEKDELEALREHHGKLLKNDRIKGGPPRSSMLRLYMRFDLYTRAQQLFMIDHKAEYSLSGSLPYRAESLPKNPQTKSALIWMCKHRYLLRLLEKGELTTEIYRLSEDELQMLVRMCPSSWYKHLFSYAGTEETRERTYYKMLYGFFNYDSSDENHAIKYPWLNEEVVKNLMEVFHEIMLGRHEQNFYNMEDLHFKNTMGEICEVVKIRLKKYEDLDPRHWVVLEYVINGQKFYKKHYREVVALLKPYIIKRADVELLQIYIARMERRKSPADLVILAEILSSKEFLTWSEKMKKMVMDHLAKRNENEVVWILAPLVNHKDKKLTIKARAIMKEFTMGDLGDDPKAWRQWYSEQ